MKAQIAHTGPQFGVQLDLGGLQSTLCSPPKPNCTSNWGPVWAICTFVGCPYMLYIYLVFSVSYPRLYNYSLIIRDFSERAIYFYSTLELVSSFSLVVKLCG